MPRSTFLRFASASLSFVGAVALAGAAAASSAPAHGAVTMAVAARSSSLPAGVGPAAQRIGSAGDVAARVSAVDAVIGHGSVSTSSRRALTTMRGAGATAATTLPKDTLAYGVPTLWNAGTTGQGTTVALIESFGDAQAQAFADSYSARYGLPKANVQTITPAGPLPSCTGDLADDCASWKGETDLDIAMVHAMAPQATIMIVATPVAETQGFQGLPEMMVGIDYVVKHRLADVISMSLGTTEETFPTLDSIKTLRKSFNEAAAAGIPVTVSTGDTGATGNTIDSTYQGQSVYPFRCVSFPADVPSVVGVGGTVVSTDATGTRTKPDSLIYFSGAGFSKIFKAPASQASVRPITKSSYRSIVDITMDGASGTSQSSPLFAGILALTKQRMGNHPLGDVQAALYATVGPKGAKAGVVDVTVGDNTYAGVPGFTATTGYDVASGWGTVNAPTFVPALTKALRAQV